MSYKEITVIVVSKSTLFMTEKNNENDFMKYGIG